MQAKFERIEQKFAAMNDKLDRIMQVLVKAKLCESKEQIKQRERDDRLKLKQRIECEQLKHLEVPKKVFDVDVEIDKIVLNFDQKYIRYVDSIKHKSVEVVMEQQFQVDIEAQEGNDRIIILDRIQGQYIYDEEFSNCKFTQ